MGWGTAMPLQADRLQQSADGVDDFVRGEGLTQGGAGAELLGVSEEVAVAELPSAPRSPRWGSVGRVRCSSRMVSMPSLVGIRRSQITRSGVDTSDGL